jgi:hypothetical protein
MTRDEIKKILQHSIANVTFIKADGTQREMICTLMEFLLPDLVGTNARRSQDVLPVWDMEKQAWRSFRIDRVIKIEAD